jgi:HAD superfamily hydrolase (TIGR01509 family)
VHSADLGKIDQKEMFGQLGGMTNTPPKQIEREWFEHVKIDTAAVELVRKLKARSQLGLLTNSPSGFVRSILRNHQLDSMFEQIVVSSEVRCAKPDPKIYELMLASLSLPASAALMIDDNPENVAGATRVGMGGLLFTSAGQLERAISELFAQ